MQNFIHNYCQIYAFKHSLPLVGITSGGFQALRFCHIATTVQPPVSVTPTSKSKQKVEPYL